MASPAQIVANQANAQHSTGPRTEAGKARVSQNAVRHGLTAKHIVLRDDEREEFAQFLSELTAELDPQGPVETITFQEVCHSAWTLRRLRKLEAEASLGTLDDFTDPQTTAVLDRLSRYQSRAQRAYYRALRELRVLQTNRALRQVKLNEEAGAELPAIVDINQLTKQTRSEVKEEAMKQAIQMIDFEAGMLLHGHRAARSAAAPGPKPVK